MALTRSLHRLFFALIRAYYDPDFLALLFRPSDALGLRAALVSLLAGDVLGAGRWRRTGGFRLLVLLSWLQKAASRWGIPLVEPVVAGPGKATR